PTAASAAALSVDGAQPPLPVTLREDEPRIATIDLTLQPDDLLQRLRNGFAMPDLDSPLVAERQAWYLNNPEYLKRVLERSKRYLYYVVSELEDRGMPTEIALLPIVESAYNPMAASRAKALGMWQFIPSTGKNYRLEQNWWMDQRRDIIASTKAALDYLQYVYEMHGDWHLALASYNWGEGAVARAIARNQAKGLPTDYQSLSMPEETRYYVPKLQALKNIIAQPELYGLKLDPIPNRPYFATVDNPGDNMDIALAAKLAEIPLDEFIALNPAYQRPVMPGNVKSPLIIPADKVQTFIENLDHHEAQDKPLSAWDTHTIRRGEKLEKIAAHYDISLAYLKQLNGLGPRSKIGPGSTLLVPGKNAPKPAQFAAIDAKLPDPPSDPVTKRICSRARHGKLICHTVATRSSSHAKAPVRHTVKHVAAKATKARPASSSKAKVASKTGKKVVAKKR
ncbi:MAG TPA: transglycosylase SLT domain-containing protein, partial [Rhodocyclaceae bacterium]|nr:transglycosylase SLT domain-containing protein [Rhodocyclaceae bacterium]